MLQDSAGDPLRMVLILIGDDGELQDQPPRVTIELVEEVTVEPRDLARSDGPPLPHLFHLRVEKIAERRAGLERLPIPLHGVRVRVRVRGRH